MERRTMICGTALCTRLGMSVTLFCSPDAHPLSSNTSVGSLSYSEDSESGCHYQINSSLIHSRSSWIAVFWRGTN